MPIIYQLGTGGILGFIVGYSLKKMMKVLAVIIGFFALILIYLGHTGIINVNYDKLAEAVKGIYGNTGKVSALITPILASLPFAGTFLLGMIIGFKVG